MKDFEHPDRCYIKKNNIFYVKLSDGRLWCPSLQVRGTKYEYNETLSSIPLDSPRKMNFTAIDFETATAHDRQPCQIGLVVVRNGVIEEKICRLIRPEGNKYSQSCINVHHITPDMTENEPPFEEVYKDISQYIDGGLLVAHNASFDIDVLKKALCRSGIPIPSFEVQCTLKIFNCKLNEACKLNNIELKDHHDGLCDAEACANLYLAYARGIAIYPDPKKEEQQNTLFKDSDFETHERLKGDILKKDLSNANPYNPFYDRKIVITGIFTQSRTSLAKKLKSMGADINTSISKNTNFVLIGKEPGESKIAKLDKLQHDGYIVRRLYQSDLDNILSGKWDDYIVDKENQKDLDFTIEHFNRHHISFCNGINCISGKELFFGKYFSGNFLIFGQITGNLGAAGDDKEIYPETNICVLSNSTLKKLKAGEKDNTIVYIQDFYNKNKARLFDFKFISEQEILDFCITRCKRCGDNVTLELYQKYIDSIIKY